MGKGGKSPTSAAADELLLEGGAPESYESWRSQQSAMNQDPRLPESWRDPAWQGPTQPAPRAYPSGGEGVGLSNQQTYRAPSLRRGSNMEPDGDGYDVSSRLRGYLGLPPDYRMDVSLIEDTYDAIQSIPSEDRTEVENDLWMDFLSLGNAVEQAGLEEVMYSPGEETASRRMKYDVALDLAGIQHAPGAFMGTRGVGEQAEKQAITEEEFARAEAEGYTPSTQPPWRRRFTGPGERDSAREFHGPGADAQGPTANMASEWPMYFPTESAARKHLEYAGFRPERESMERQARQRDALMQSMTHPYGQSPAEQRERQAEAEARAWVTSSQWARDEAQAAARAEVAAEARRELIRQVPQVPGADLSGLVDWVMGD
jgi:hypothetical protein